MVFSSGHGRGDRLASSAIPRSAAAPARSPAAMRPDARRSAPTSPMTPASGTKLIATVGVHVATDGLAVQHHQPLDRAQPHHAPTDESTSRITVTDTSWNAMRPPAARQRSRTRTEPLRRPETPQPHPVPQLANGWSHPRGENPLQMVPYSWRTTPCAHVDPQLLARRGEGGARRHAVRCLSPVAGHGIPCARVHQGVRAPTVIRMQPLVW